MLLFDGETHMDRGASHVVSLVDPIMLTFPWIRTVATVMWNVRHHTILKDVEMVGLVPQQNRSLDDAELGGEAL